MAHVLRLMVLGLLMAAPAGAAESRMLCDFEGPADLRLWQVTAGSAELVELGATHGERALEIAFDPAGRYHPAYINAGRLPRDWSAFDALVLDVENPTDRSMSAYVLIADRAWQDAGRSYWNRHNGSTMLAPGRNEWVIPLRGLYRGEPGSRNNDIKRDIDPDSIVRLDFGFGTRGETGSVIVDALRLVRAERPTGVAAFDFGPPSQQTMLGWTAVSHESRYDPQRGFGWHPPAGAPWDGAARDTTFGPPLIRDFCEAGGYAFRIDAPAGDYRVLLIFENSGYWGGEQARHTWRRVSVNGREAWREDRPDGPAHALYRFEDTEPIGLDVWDAYMVPELARQVTFAARSEGGGLTFRFEADRVWGSKVSALAFHRADDAAATAWLDGELEKLAAEFRRAAVCLDEPAAPFDPGPEWRALGLAAWPVAIGDAIAPNSTPPLDLAPPHELSVARLAARGEFEPLCVALRPLRDLGRCRLALEPWEGPRALEAELSAVRYNTSRGLGSLAYHVRPHTLRPAREVGLPAGVTRQVVVTVRVDAADPPGEYRGALRVENDDGLLLRVPLRVSVSPVVLERETEFLMGYFGLMPPPLVPAEKRWEVLERTLVMLREHGANAVSGGPSWRLTGWADGAPVIDYGEMDRFFALLRRHGFDRPLNGYGGARFRGLHDRYEKGAAGARVERQSGQAYDEALLRCWRAVDEHARREGWPTILYAMCDETRVRDVAERELEFMRMMARVSSAFPRTVRTSGSYSVGFARRPADPDDLAYWHQRFFEALDVSSLNRHDETVMDEARRLGKEVHIYNQGRTRYSFGFYQWAEFARGVRARWQWHLNILHGYQFFDLDGREPDTSMICYGRDGLYPTIHFERCGEGAEDFYLCQTLQDAVERGRAEGADPAALRAGEALLEEIVQNIGLNQRAPPPGFDADRMKERLVRAIEEIAAP